MRLRNYILFILALNLILLCYLFLRQDLLQKSHIKIDLINDFYKKETPQIKTLILGDSTIAFGLDPTFLDQGYSLAIPGSTFLTAHTELNRFLSKKNKPNCVILWTASIEAYYDEYFWSIYLGSDLYNWKEINEIYDQSILLKAFPHTSYDRASYLAKSYFYSTLYFSPLKQIKISSYFNSNNFYQQQKDIILQKNGFIPFFPPTQKSSLITERNKYLFQSFYKIESDDIYLNEFLSKTNKEKIKVVFLEMPILKNQDQKVYEFNESHINHLSEIIQKYTHAEIVRNTADLEPEHFRDISHLNAEGALVFSQAMSSTLKARCEKFE